MDNNLPVKFSLWMRILIAIANIKWKIRNKIKKQGESTEKPINGDKHVGVIEYIGGKRFCRNNDGTIEPF